MLPVAFLLKVLVHLLLQTTNLSLVFSPRHRPVVHY